MARPRKRSQGSWVSKKHPSGKVSRFKLNTVGNRRREVSPEVVNSLENLQQEGKVEYGGEIDFVDKQVAQAEVHVRRGDDGSVTVGDECEIDFHTHPASGDPYLDELNNSPSATDVSNVITSETKQAGILFAPGGVYVYSEGKQTQDKLDKLMVEYTNSNKWTPEDVERMLENYSTIFQYNRENNADGARDSVFRWHSFLAERLDVKVERVKNPNKGITFEGVTVFVEEWE